jgi:hypothetical protein
VVSGGAVYRGSQTFVQSIEVNKTGDFLPGVYSPVLTWKSSKFLPLNPEINCYDILVCVLFSFVFLDFHFVSYCPLLSEILSESNRFSFSVP